MNIDKFTIDTSPFEKTLTLRLPTSAIMDDEAAKALQIWNSPLIYAEYDRHHFYYDITGRVPLRSQLSKTMNKKETIALLAAIADVLMYGLQQRINPKFILLDSDLVFVSEETGSLRFICVPAVNNGLSPKPFRSYIRELIVNMQYDGEESLEYIGQIINFINLNKKLSPGEFLDFLDELEGAEAGDRPKAPAYEDEVPVQPVSSAAAVSSCPYLIRKKTGEQVSITKDEFKIGKIAGMADYMLSDNPAVSRMHAIITKMDGEYYICDNYSTNSTYLNGEQLEAGKNYILLNGVRVSFANDEFTFYENR